MADPDFNLLRTLDTLLSEGSVARAGKRLRLSPSAMSRALARLRDTTGDPLLVRAGRGLVPTPRALELRERVAHAVKEAETILRPAAALDLRSLCRTFVLRTSEGFVEAFGTQLVSRVNSQAPNVQLHFLPKADKDSAPLRDGSVDLETGVVDEGMGPEIRSQALFRDRLIGVVRARHALAKGRMTPARYAAGRHIVFSRSGKIRGSVDETLASLGLQRKIEVIVGGFATALSLARTTDLVATVPQHHTGSLRDGMFSFALPFKEPEITVSLLWHPKMDADPGHKWLRACVLGACRKAPAT